MKKLLAILCLLLIVASDMQAQRCSRCSGRGKIETRRGVSAFGVRDRKVTCRYCGKLIYACDSHWDDCPSCGGSGQKSSSSSRDNKIDRDAPVDVYSIYLSESEYADYQNAASLAIRGTKKEVACSQCHGSGQCYGCKGTGLSPIQVPSDAELGMPTYCSICAGDGKCSKCFGQKTMLVDSDEGKQEAREKLQYYSKLVQERQAEATARQNGQDISRDETAENQESYGSDDEYNSSSSVVGSDEMNVEKNNNSNFLLSALVWLKGLGLSGILGLLVVVLIAFCIIKGWFD